MKKVGRHAAVLAVLLLALGVGSYALANSGSSTIRGNDLNGYEENPDISTVASGDFRAQINNDDTGIEYELSYSNLEGDVLQAHIHFGKAAVNGGISLFLCTNLGNGPAGTPTCPGPNSGTVTGTLDAADVVGPAGQGIEVGALGEILAAIRAGHAYANVHSTKWPGGEIRAQLNDRG
jgi:CHRD domain